MAYFDDFLSLYTRLCNEKIDALTFENAKLRRQIEQLKRHENNKNSEK